MKKNKRIRNTFFLIAALVSVFIFLGFYYQMLQADPVPPATLDQAIAAGKEQLFSKTVTGVLDAHQTFLLAKTQYDATATDQQKIKLRAYLALTRLADVIMRNDSPGSDTLRKLLAQYGITFTGDSFDDIKEQLPINSQDKPILPATAPSGDALRAFLAGPFLTAINSSIADMNIVINLLDANGTTESREIIGKSLLNPDGNSLDPNWKDVEVDDGDYYLFRALLKAAKGYILTWTSYNQEFDVRELVALLNADMFNIQKFLDLHPDLLKVRNGGLAVLAEARMAFTDAIDDYLAASLRIRNDAGVQSGAEELISLQEGDAYSEGLTRENLANIKTSLQNNLEMQFINDRIGTDVDYGDRINFFLIFTLSPRDLLPQFSTVGQGLNPIAGTVGYGLTQNHDPTVGAKLGGILPDQTQELWQQNGEVLQPTGTFTIPTEPITVDGAVSDWSGLSPALEDVLGETDPARDITRLYLAKDANYLYFRIDLAGNYNPNNYAEYWLKFKKLPGSQEDVIGDVKLNIRYLPWLTNKWQLYKLSYNGNNSWSQSSDLNLDTFSVQSNGPYIEGRIALTNTDPTKAIGEIGGRFIGVETAWADYNDTTIQITPAAAVTGTLNVPNYDGTGLIYVQAYRYASGFDTDTSDKLGGTVIYPSAYTAGMTYTVDNLPVGEKIFMFVHWDKDMNGIVTPDDYTNFYLPLTTAAPTESVPQPNILNLTTPDNHRSFPEPKFTQAGLHSIRQSNGTTSITFPTRISGPSPEDVTVTVHGPGGDWDYTLSPGSYSQQKGLGYNLTNKPSYVPNGDYTFEAVDSLGRWATPVTYHYEYNGSLPFVDTATASPVNRAFVGTTTPTLSWQAPSTGGPYYYNVRIEDWLKNDVWFQSDTQTETSVTVPAGLLQPDTPYRWTIRVYDNADHTMNITTTDSLAFHTGAAVTPTIQQVGLMTRPPAGSSTSYSTSVNVYQLPGVFPDEVKAIRLKNASGTLIKATGTGTPPIPISLSYRFTNNAYYGFSYSSSSAPATGNYSIEVDYQRTGIDTVVQTTAMGSIPFAYLPVSQVDITTLVPADNYYFDTATPTFSWQAVNDPDPSYRITIYDSLNKFSVWTSSWTKGTSLTVPPRVLDPGRTYYWNLRSSSDYDPNGSATTGNYNSYITANTGMNVQNIFTINKSPATFPAPVFKAVNIFSRKDPERADIRLSAFINGPSPDDVTVSVHGPGGYFTLSPSKYHQQKGLRYGYTIKSSSLATGYYIFEAVDSYGRSATPVTYYYEYNGTLPYVDTATFSPADRTFVGTTTPTLSWQPPAGGGTYYYYVRINDWSDTEVFFESGIQTETSVTVPAGLLQPNTPYTWFVRVYDRNTNPMNCAQTLNLAFHTGTAQAPVLQQVNLRTRPSGATQTSYKVGIEIFRLWGVFPDEVTEIRLKGAFGTLISPSPGTASIIYRYRNSAYYNLDYSSSAPLATGSYTVEVDYKRTGDAQTTTLITASFPYEYLPVLPVDITSLTPGDNHYFDSVLPTFSWSAVAGANIHYRVMIRDPISNWGIWSSDWSTATAAVIPAGILSRGGTYYWHVQSSSDYDPSLDQATGRYDSYANMMANGAMVNFRFTIKGSSTALKGDLNDDGRVDMLDAILALQVLSGMKPGLRAYYPTSGADVGNNGKVGAEDLIYILQRVSGLRQ